MNLKDQTEMMFIHRRIEVLLNLYSIDTYINKHRNHIPTEYKDVSTRNYFIEQLRKLDAEPPVWAIFWLPECISFILEYKPLRNPLPRIQDAPRHSKTLQDAERYKWFLILNHLRQRLNSFVRCNPRTLTSLLKRLPRQPIDRNWRRRLMLQSESRQCLSS